MESVYNHLDDQNRALVDPKYHHKPHQENIIIDNNGTNLHPNVIEESSIYNKEIENTENQSKELTDEEKEEKAKKLLSEPIYNYAKEREISPDKMLMIANPRLAKHLPLQESLINDVVTKSNNDAKNTVDQVIMDLETGALSKDGKSYVIYYHLRDKIDRRPEGEKSPFEYYFELSKDMLKFLQHITGYKIVKGEFEYSEKHIENSEKHRIDIIKSLGERTVLALKEDLSCQIWNR